MLKGRLYFWTGGAVFLFVLILFCVVREPNLRSIPFHYVDTQKKTPINPEPFPYVRVSGSWVKTRSGEKALPNSVKIECWKEQGVCSEARAVRVGKTLIAEPVFWKIRVWNSKRILASSSGQKSCLYIDRKEKRCAFFPKRSQDDACRTLKGAEDLIYLVDWNRGNSEVK